MTARISPTAQGNHPTNCTKTSVIHITSFPNAAGHNADGPFVGRSTFVI
jgi:hypothetical protein